MPELQNYLINPPYDAPRLTDTQRQKAISQNWEYALETTPMHGTLATAALRFDLDTNRFIWNDFSENRTLLFQSDRQLLGSFAVMSSAMMLYRLICVFVQSPTVGSHDDFYKSVWRFPLRHLPSGEFITLLDYKAGWTVNAMFTEVDQLPASLANDLLELLNFLISPDVSHPYDKTLAGSVA